MSSSTKTLPRTSIAVVSWLDGNDNTLVRVYTQDINGGIRESRYDGKSWSGGTTKDVIATAKPNSPIAAFTKGGPQIHVFYLTADNIINGVRQSGPGRWTEDTINKAKLEATPESRLAFAGAFDKSEHHLFWQAPRGAILHAPLIGDDWFDHGSTVGIGEALIGTGLAAVSFLATDDNGYFNALRVYYQRPDGTVTDHGLEGPHNLQKIDHLNGTNVAPGANLAALSKGDPTSPVFLLFYSNKDTWVSEGSYYNGGWHFENHPGETEALPGSGIAVAKNSGLIRVYYQDKTNEIVEFSATAPSASGTKTVIPTGVAQ